MTTFDCRVEAVLTFTIEANSVAEAQRIAELRLQRTKSDDNCLVGGEHAYVTPDADTLTIEEVQP